VTPNAQYAPVEAEGPTSPPRGEGRFAVHPSRRYFQDAKGKPVFLIGYYMWASIDPTKRINSQTWIDDFISEGATYRLNYIRVNLSLGLLNTNTTPFKLVNGKVDLDQWDENFWTGLHYHLALARDKGVMVHVGIFDGVNLRGGPEIYRWPSSYWNPANQVRVFYPNPDIDGDGSTDEADNFYQLTAFQANTGIGFYQRKVIDRALAEMVGYPNVFVEIGNELFGSPSIWNRAVYEYMKARTQLPVTQNGGALASQIDGHATHQADSSLEAKALAQAHVGKVHPYWDDPDGPLLKNAGTADENRRAAWYALVGGAAGWGGFTVAANDGLSGWDRIQTAYYRTLMRFLEVSRLAFWEMTPQHGLVSNGNDENSVLAKADAHYLVYVRDDSTVTVDLSGLTRPATGRTFNPKSGECGSIEPVTGGASWTFGKPAGADDWVILITADE
jgi:hypothetical protein